MIDSLKKNIEQEMKILQELRSYAVAEYNSPTEKRLMESVKISLQNKLRMINASIPDILSEISPTKKIDDKKKDIEKLSPIVNKDDNTQITLRKEDREKFIKESNFNLALIKKIKKQSKEKDDDKLTEFKGARGYVKLSNKFFFNLAKKFTDKGYFADLKIDLKKANMEVLFSSYIAMTLFSTLLSVLVGVLLAIILLFFNISLVFPFLTPTSTDIVARFIQTSWVVLAIPVGTFFAFYYYPSSERDSIAKKIDQELPFAVIHMSAISGSGIEPAELFKIIGNSKEYPTIKKEIRKILNQINLYGYDLVTGLNYVSKNTPSQKLSELFSGLATTITSGGDLSEFFEKRSETLLVGYRLEREKFTKVAETFMDIYISLVIAAPMILMLLLVMIQVSSINIGLGTGQIAFLIIAAISILNAFFIAFLHMKQPSY